MIGSYHNGHLYIIDVSQSVEHDHPAAFDFLRLDIKNVDEFWARRGVQTLGLRRTFDFVVADKIHPSDEEETDDRLSEYIKVQMQRQEQSAPEAQPTVETSAQQPPGSLSQVKISEPSNDPSPAPPKEDQAHEDAVFMHSYIPRNLNEVYDPERDVGKLTRGEGDQLIYGTITGVVSVNQQQSAPDSDDSDADEDDVLGEGEDESEGREEGEEAKWTPRVPRGHRHEDREAKKVHISSLLSVWMIKPGILCSHLPKLGSSQSGKRRGSGETKAKNPKGGEEEKNKADTGAEVIP